MATQLEVQKIAQRYAKALFELVVEQGGSDLQPLYDWFGVFSNVVSHDPAFAKFLANPTCAATDKQALLKESFKTNGIKSLEQLIALLTENERLHVLDAIGQHFSRLVDDRNRVQDAYVTVPIPLNEALTKRFEDRLKEVFKLQQVRLHVTVDPAILAGAVVKLGDKLIDGSAQGKLKMLSKQVG